MPIKNSYEEILLTPMGENDAGAETIGDYLHSLLHTLWREGEGFSGKRPFGNSSWEYDLYQVLIKHGHIEGALDEDGYVDWMSKPQGEQVIFDLIDFVFEKYRG